VAVGRVVLGVYPEPAETLPRPPNNHLEYAITWFSLALALAVMFAIWVRKPAAVLARDVG
jgi:surfeit locus 1 family protein